MDGVVLQFQPDLLSRKQMVLAGFKAVSVISEAEKKLVGQLTDCLSDFR